MEILKSVAAYNILQIVLQCLCHKKYIHCKKMDINIGGENGSANDAVVFIYDELVKLQMMSLISE